MRNGCWFLLIVLVGSLILLGVGLATGYLLHLVFPGIDLGTGTLIGILTPSIVIFCFYLLTQVFPVPEPFPMDDEDLEEEFPEERPEREIFITKIPPQPPRSRKPRRKR